MLLATASFSFVYASDYYTGSGRFDHARNISHDYDYDYDYDRYWDNRSYEHPSCSISVTNHSGSGHNRTVTLSWSSSYAKTAHLSGVGSVGTNGAQVMYYPFDSRYTLTVYGPGGAATCTAENTYYDSQFYSDDHRDYRDHMMKRDHPYVFPMHTMPLPPAPHIVNVYPASYVSLTQIPYTGFDFGTVGNALYWLGLLTVALAGAYLVVYYAGFRELDLARNVALAARNQIRFVRSIIR